MKFDALSPAPSRLVGKFEHPDWTAKGERRASVMLGRLETLWINTGTLCNITCANCYIESSPTNERLVYISADEVRAFLDEIEAHAIGTREIGLTGGEPFLNPEATEIIALALGRGHEVLVLTNAMQPLMRPKVQRALLALREHYGDRLRLRVSLDHFTREKHDLERGKGAFTRTLKGLDWLAAHGFKLAIAGRTCWGESDEQSRAGYAALIAAHGWTIDATSPAALSLLPEMDGKRDVPEITTACWGILHKSPTEMMCASSRMVVKRQGADRPTVLPCTLIAYDKRFDMGATLAEAAKATGQMFDAGSVKLNHPHCAKFCVLGGGSCSAKA